MLKGSSVSSGEGIGLGYPRPDPPLQFRRTGPPRLDARSTLLAVLREQALVIGEVTLASGRTAQYYVDARRALLSAAGFTALGELVAAEARRLGAVAVGGPTLGADPIACSVLCVPDSQLSAFIVRKDRKEHGLQRWVEGPEIPSGASVLVVEDVVTSGGSLITAIERLREERITIAGAVSVVDRLAGGANAIEAALEGAPYSALFTIDDVYPDRPDR